MITKLRRFSAKIIHAENNKTTRIKIKTDLSITAQTKDSSCKFKVSDILLDSHGKLWAKSYYKINDLSGIENIMIEINGEKIFLPEKMNDRLAYYMREQNNIKTYFDCASFAHLLNSVDYTPKMFYPHKFIIENISNENLHNLQTGDTLFISESSNPKNYKATHFAIYLGKNLHISKFGPSGKLIVTDMDNMMKGFGGNYIFKMIPKF